MAGAFATECCACPCSAVQVVRQLEDEATQNAWLPSVIVRTSIKKRIDRTDWAAAAGVDVGMHLVGHLGGEVLVFLIACFFNC